MYYINRLFSEYNFDDPDRDFSYLSETDLVKHCNCLTEDILLDNKRVIILAEQGMGKSTFVTRLKERKDSILLINLPSTIENDFIQLHSHNNSIIIFDSLDEVDSNIRNCVFRFCENNRNIPVIITSRPSKFIENIKDFKMFKLLPFTRENINVVLRNENIDVDDFFNRLNKSDIISSCGNPMQLQIAINMFKNNKFNINDYESLKLFIKDSLCETDDSKELAYTNDDIYECSKWIATSMVLSNKNTVYCGQEKNCNNNHLSISDLAGKFDKVLIETTLKRVIFKAIDNFTYIFKNVQFRDFLAVEGIKENINRKHWKKLFINSVDNIAYSGAEEILSGLAVFDDDIFMYLFDNEPWKLYKNTTLFQKKTRLDIFKKIYSMRDTIPYDELHNHSLENLYCDDVEKEIIEILKKDGLSYGLYWLIIFIIDYPKYNLSKYLLTILENEKDQKNIECIIYILSKSKDKVIIDELKSLLNKQDIFKDDNNDEVRGYILRACYKELSLKELLSYITDEKRSTFYGAYFSFINELCSKIDTVVNNDNKIIALEWVKTIFRSNKSNGITPDILEISGLLTSPQKVAKSILTYIWKELFNDKITPFFIPLFNTYDYTGFFNLNEYGKRTSVSVIRKEELNSDDDKIITILFNGIVNNQITPNHLIYYLSIPRVKKIIEKIIETKTQLNQDYIKKFEEHFSTDFINNNLTLLNELYDSNLGFKTVDEYIADFEERLKPYEKRDNDRKKSVYDDKKQSGILENNLKKILANLDSDNEDRYIFTWIVDYVIRTEENYYYKKVTNSKFYNDLNNCQKNNLINRALDYLNLNEFKGNELTLLHALVFIFDFDDIIINKINQSFWNSNIKHIITISIPSFIEDFNLDKVISFIYEKYQSSCEEAILDIVKNFNDQNYQQIIDAWGDKITPELLEKLLSFCKTSSAFVAVSQLLKDLARTKYKANIINFIDEYLNKNINNKLIEERYILFLSIGLKLDFNRFLPSFISIEERDSNSFRKTVEKVAEKYSYSVNTTLTPSDPSQFATLYIALEKYYPDKDMPKHDGVYTVDNIDRVYEFKKFILNSLTGKIVKGSFQAVQSITEQLPAMQYLTHSFSEIRKKEVLFNRKSLSSKEIKELYLNSNKELIKSSKDLFDFVIYQLEEYEKHLQGKYDQVMLLWDNINGTPKPKEENHFSSNIGAFLELNTKDIIIAREVQLKIKRHKEDKGSRVDILISVLDNERNDRYTLCIEVKLSKNREIKNNFKTQLIDKYMTEDRADSGIFLVGYFSDNHLYKFKGVKNIDTLKSYLKKQEKLYQQADKYIKGIVVDCRLNQNTTQDIEYYI